MKKVKTGLLSLLAVVALLFAGATMVQAVQAGEEADGVGNALVYPLFLGTDAAFTEFTLVNTQNTTGCNTTQAVHIQVRSQGDSKDLLDFCVVMTENDVYKAKISSTGDSCDSCDPCGSCDPCVGGATLFETLNDVDYVLANINWRGPESTQLIENDQSTCAYGTQIGYIVAYGVVDCENPNSIDPDAQLMGNTRIIETATSKIMALNAVAVQANNLADVPDELRKDELYMIWEFEKTAAVLTVPTFGNQVSANDGMELVGADREGYIDNELEGCGMLQLNRDFEEMYDLDENMFSRQSPHYYPANEVSIVNFADAESNTDSTQFYINGSAKYWGLNFGLNFTGATLTEGWTRWAIPDNTDCMNPENESLEVDRLHNVVCTYFISTNNSLAWMPCQYQECVD